jgi:hypothetical protein
MAADETTQERKLRLTHEAQAGRDAEDMLAKFGNSWYAAARNKALHDLSNAMPSDLVRVQAEYRAAKSLYDRMKQAVSKGKRAAETLNREAMSNG